MSNLTLSKASELPSMFNDFFKPWNDLIENGPLWRKGISIPAVNVVETNDEYKLSLAAPGLQKDDFKIDIEGNMLSITSEKESSEDEKDARYTRKEYSYSAFTRSFNLPDDVKQDQIEATYTNGVLVLSLPKKDESKKVALSKQIAVK